MDPAGDDPIVLTPGGTTHVNVIAGNRGHGNDALAVTDENFLDIARDELLVTVIAKDKDKDNNEVTATSRIKEHC